MNAAARILVLHHGYPGQFAALLPRLQARGHELTGLLPDGQGHQTMTGNHTSIPVINYKLKRGNGRDSHPWSVETETKVLRGEAAAITAEQMRRNGYKPDLILGHPGWGELLFLDRIWPGVPQLHYVEFCYDQPGTDLEFGDSLQPRATWQDHAKAKMKNANVFLNLERMTAGITPTPFQHSLIPSWGRQKTTIIHDGIDTDWLCPDGRARIQLHCGLTLSAGDPVVTFVNRTFEPYRGIHVFLRALSKAQQAHPSLQAILVGKDSPRVSYGANRTDGQGWLSALKKEMGDQLDWTRIHCTGKISHQHLRRLYQISAAHVYLTYPFVLSWSLLEAMSSGCLVVSNTVAPVQDYIKHGHNGLLSEFSDPDTIASHILLGASNRSGVEQLRATARESVLNAGLNVETCSRRRVKWIEQVLTAGGGS
jgi:glycosyltransferase involved in cell wall biosynthesis